MRQPDITAFAGATHGSDERADVGNHVGADAVAFDAPATRADVEAEFVSPNPEDCAFCQRRWTVQQDALVEAQELFRGHDVKRLSLFADEIRGEHLVRIPAAYPG